LKNNKKKIELNSSSKQPFLNWLKNGQNPTKWTQQINMPTNGYKKCFERRMSALEYFPKGTLLLLFSY